MPLAQAVEHLQEQGRRLPGKLKEVEQSLADLKVEKLAADEGAAVEIDKVLLVADGDDVKVGSPYVEGGKVTATVKATDIQVYPA